MYAEDVTNVAETASPETSSASAQLIALSPTRRAIAENLSHQAAIPAVTTFRTLDCSALQTFREELGLSPLPVFVAALARTVASHPLINARWQETHIKINDVVNAAIAVDTERGLMIPSRCGAPGYRGDSRTDRTAGRTGARVKGASAPATSPTQR